MTVIGEGGTGTTGTAIASTLLADTFRFGTHFTDKGTVLGMSQVDSSIPSY